MLLFFCIKTIAIKHIVVQQSCETFTINLNTTYTLIKFNYERNLKINIWKYYVVKPETLKKLIILIITKSKRTVSIPLMLMLIIKPF